MENQELAQRLKEADALYASAQMDAALKAYRTVLAEDETIAWAHSRVGAILAQLKNLEGAEMALLRAIELDPLLPQAHSNLGNVYYARRDYESALAKYKDAVALDNNNPTFHENLHAAYKKLGKLTEAVTALKQAHRLDREQSKTQAKATLSALKENISKRRGCLGTTMTIFFVLTLVLVLIVAM